MPPPESREPSRTAPRPLEIVVALEEGGERLDRYLARRLDQPRNRIQSWMREGGVVVDSRPAKPSQKTEPGSMVVVTPPPPPPEHLSPEPGELEILHQDSDLLVIAKPAGLVVHPGAGRQDGTLCHRLVAYDPQLRSVGHPQRPGIVHRLDQGTSGVMVVARTDSAYRDLVTQFAERSVEKVYLALCFGAMAARSTATGRIARHATVRTKMAVRPDGRPARSDVLRLAVAVDGPASAVAVRLHTGRTHQIRVHLAHLGHPLLGDETYGGSRARTLRHPRHRRAVQDLARPALHAFGLALRHPTSQARLAFSTPAPRDLELLWRELSSASSLPQVPFPWPG